MTAKLFLETEIAQEIWQLFREIEEEMQLRAPLNMYLAGGAAMHLYDGERVPRDVDAIVDARHWGLAPRFCVPSPRLALDPGYFETKSCLPERFRDRATRLDVGTSLLQLHVVSPVDLAISKLYFFPGVHERDVRKLLELGLISSTELQGPLQELAGEWASGPDRFWRDFEPALRALGMSNAQD